MKACTRCGAEKPESEFHKNKRAKDGLTAQCRECSNRSSAKSKEKNGRKPKTPEGAERSAARYRIRQRAYYQRKKNERNRSAKEYYAHNREKMTAYNIEYQRKYRAGELEDDIRLERQLREMSEEWADEIKHKHLDKIKNPFEKQVAQPPK